jgi:guanylate kinase
LQDKSLDLTLSVSVTTRARRSSEADGIHYHFISQREFEAMRVAGDLLESAEVHSHRYGTPRAPVEAVLAQGRDMLFDIDWQGAQQVRESLGDDVVSIFILPPSMAELRARLDRRAEDSAATIAARLDNARKEIERWRQYDYVLVNDDLQRAYSQVVSIIAAERLREPRVAVGVEAFVRRLLES